MEQIVQHPWMSGEVPTYEDVQKEFTERDIRNQTLIEDEKAKKEEEKLKRVEARLGAMRSGPK